MTVLITGGSGFVGLNVAERLLREGTDVIIFDLAAPPSNFVEAVHSLSGNLTYAEGDTRNRKSLLDAMNGFHVDRVVHGAAITAGIEREKKDTDKIIEINILGTINVLEASLAAGVHRVVQFGSGAIFGSGSCGSLLLDEDRDAPIPDSIYGISKYAAERVAVRYRNSRSIDVIVARLGVAFGRWEYDTGVRDTLSIPYQLTSLARQGTRARFLKSLPVDWVYADDVAEGTARLLDTSFQGRAVYNLSAGHSWDAAEWSDLLKLRYTAFDYEVVSEIGECNVAKDIPFPRPPFSIANIQNDFGFSPTFGIHESFDSYNSWLDNSQYS
jgi:nucleoside-diphosphate-sugar epimerase